jgi:hypothetical protein
MPLIYGEGQRKAFERLREEIDRPFYRQKVNCLEKVFYQMRNRPKELGFTWETGAPERQLKVDDGLGAEYFLPVELCTTPEVNSPLLSRPWLDTNMPSA